MPYREKQIAIGIRDLWFAYGKKPILRGVDLEIKTGEICAIIGQNAAGKSTLLKAIAGILEPERGAIKIALGGEVAINSSALSLARKGLSFVMQGARVLPSLTVAEHLAIGIGEFKKIDRSERIEEVLQLLPQLKGLQPRRAGLLSGGERQLLTLATQLVRRPQILLLDEPSAGLAAPATNAVFDLFAALNQSRRTTIVIVEHNVEPTLKIAGRAIALDAGKIARTIAEPGKWLEPKSLNRLYAKKHRLDASEI